MKRIIILLGFCLTLALPVMVLAQDDQKPQDPPSTLSTAAAQAGAVINNSAGTQLPVISPMVGQMPFPGGYFTVLPGEMVLYSRPLFRSVLSFQELKSLSKGDKNKPRIHVLRRLPENENPVRFLDYTPSPDHVIGVGYCPSVIGSDNVGPVSHVVRELKEQSFTQNVVVYGRPGFGAVTKGSSNALNLIGEGVTHALGLGAGGGFNRGTATTFAIDVYSCMVVAFDDNPERPPAPPVAKPAPQPPPPPPAPPTEKQVVSGQVVVERPKALAPQAPTVPAEPAKKACSIEKLTVNFDFDKYDVKDEYRRELDRIGKSLADQPDCQFEIQGYTDKVGTSAYNANLGLERSKAVWDILVARYPSLGKKENGKDRLVFSSLGKNFPKGDWDQENRRVVVAVISDKSGQ